MQLEFHGTESVQVMMEPGINQNIRVNVQDAYGLAVAVRASTNGLIVHLRLPQAAVAVKPQVPVKIKLPVACLG